MTLDRVLFRYWALIEADFQSEYGIDLGTGVLKDRSWRWFRIRLRGLTTADTRLARKLKPPEKPPTPATPRRR